MKGKQKIRVIVIFILLFLFGISALSGLVLYFAPEGHRSGQMIILGFQKNLWVQVHSLSSFLMLVTGIWHIIIEWPILTVLVKQFFKKED